MRTSQRSRLRLQMLIIPVIMLSGCAGVGSLAEYEPAPTAADYGTPVAQAEAERQAQQFMAQRLKDPDSAQYVWQDVHEGYIKDAAIRGGLTHYGYELDGTINARNSYGGYTGSEGYVFLFYNGVLYKAAHYRPTSYGGILEPLN